MAQKMKVWGAFYNSNIYESDAGLLSFHMTKEGARAAMEKSKSERPNPEDWEKWHVRLITVKD